LKLYFANSKEQKQIQRRTRAKKTFEVGNRKV